MDHMCPCYKNNYESFSVYSQHYTYSSFHVIYVHMKMFYKQVCMQYCIHLCGFCIAQLYECENKHDKVNCLYLMFLYLVNNCVVVTFFSFVFSFLCYYYYLPLTIAVKLLLFYFYFSHSRYCFNIEQQQHQQLQSNNNVVSVLARIQQRFLQLTKIRPTCPVVRWDGRNG